MYNEGISKAGDLLDLAVSLDIIDKRGSYYSYSDVRLGQGRENSKQYLKENPDLAKEIELAIRQQATEGGLMLGFGAETDEVMEEDIS